VADYVERCRAELLSGGLCQRSTNHAGYHSLTPDGRTLKQLAQEAYDVQDASNLSGVVKSFFKALCDLRDIPGIEDNKSYHHHAITRCWVDKIASLTGMQPVEWSSVSVAAMSEVVRLKNEP